MKHLPVLLCGLVLAGAPFAAARGEDDAHRPPDGRRPAPRAGQRVARLDAPVPRAAAPDDDACLSMIADDPAGALDYAADWSRRGGGDRSAQCSALAQVALGDPEDGAGALDRLSRDAALPAPRRATIADQAGQAWLLAARPDRALAAATLAVGLDPQPTFAIGRARAALAAHQPVTAIATLSPVLAAHTALADALVVRATALRETGALARARDDIDAACRIEPDAPDALLERGVLRERTGDLDGARSDWGRVLELSPDTHDADLAQQDLALLDAGPEAR